LCGLEIQFKYQVPIDRYIVDFIIDNIIIEVFGNYWHSEKFLCSQNCKNRDFDKLKYFKKAGYNTIIIWENELINETDKVVERIKHEITKNKQDKRI
jgi:very-short-patch-repair endonuclease